ncbi:fluoride efflux transporter CrcB [Cytobacillus sp. NCCP-133]|uniref:fluoride efflux transporter CrcB n=1 Tax=Cytobacillus sp. NCCP-133 TaxID=766848 RepID=UPI002230519B|nr:fluoride efflux transporter CrcB [Cytobacillus sp. NCCP-133]GLB59582.1 chromosome condensation protein CcrB [Cytobacillus sp. NCCP-133]
MIYFFVGLAGMLGASLRYIVGVILFTESVFPFATLLVNLIGSFLLAWLTTNIIKKFSISPIAAATIGTGFVGSFTTFSTLSIETVTLFQDGKLLMGLSYVLISVLGGLVMSRLGFKISEEVRES